VICLQSRMAKYRPYSYRFQPSCHRTFSITEGTLLSVRFELVVLSLRENPADLRDASDNSKIRA
jgi:hypothetical protein